MKTIAPLRFAPLLKPTLWGGEKIGALKHLSEAPPRVGESWEVSGVEGSESVVADGPYAGCSLNKLVELLGPALVGEKNHERFGGVFPLLVKFIDARQQLSVQVHPSDEQAQRRGYMYGKTEMWYVMDAAPKATLLAGWRERLSPAAYKQRVEQGTIQEALAQHEVCRGDVFFLPAGRVHSIGAGCLLAEIQQTSDLTYRIYDFDRRDSEGHRRPLHTAEAADCIDYGVERDYRTRYNALPNEAVTLVSCPYFTTRLCTVESEMSLDVAALDSFVALVGLEGAGTVTTSEGHTMTLRAGESLLVAASTQRLTLRGAMRLLATYI